MQIVYKLGEEKYKIDFLDKFNSVEEVINYFAGQKIFSEDNLNEISAEVIQCLTDIYYIDDFILEKFFIRIGYVHERYFFETFGVRESHIMDFAKYVKKEIKYNFARHIERQIERDYAFGKSRVRELLSDEE